MIFMRSTGWALQYWGIALKSLSHEFFFRKNFGLPYAKTSSDRRNISKNLTLGFFRALKCSYFVLKVFRGLAGNELAGDDEGNCENSQLTLTNPLISFNFVSISLEILLKSCPIMMSTLLSCKYGSALRRRTAWIKRRFLRRVTKTVSRSQCSGRDYDEKLPLLHV